MSIAPQQDNKLHRSEMFFSENGLYHSQLNIHLIFAVKGSQSIHPGRVPKWIAYIENRETHHKKPSFRTEF
jgi:hypothetical protein